MVKQTVANVPQVQGKELGSMEQLMEEDVGVGERGKEKLTWDAKEDVVIDPFGNGADAFCTEDVKGRISGFTIDAPS